MLVSEHESASHLSPLQSNFLFWLYYIYFAFQMRPFFPSHTSILSFTFSTNLSFSPNLSLNFTKLQSCICIYMHIHIHNNTYTYTYLYMHIHNIADYISVLCSPRHCCLGLLELCVCVDLNSLVELHSVLSLCSEECALPTYIIKS